MPRLVLLGVASAFPRAETDPTSFVVEGYGGRLILVDCGGSGVRSLLLAGLDPAKLDAVFLTHTHPDHLGGFPLLIHGLRMLGRERELVVAGHAGTLRAAQALLDAVELNREKGFPVAWHERPAHARAEGSIAGFDIATFPVEHSRATLGLRIGAKDGSLVYSADTAPCDAVIVEAAGVELLVHEMGSLKEERHPYHTGPDELARIAAEANPARLVIVHTPPLDWPAREDVIATVRGRFSGQIDFGEALRSYAYGAA